MKKLTNTPHDRNFRLSLSNKEVAKDFLTTHLPKQFLKTINLQTLTMCPDSFITKDLEENCSDILYKAKTTKNHYCYTYVLIEHMSTATWDMPIRMLQYQLLVIETHRRQHPKDRKIPIVFPVLVYNGKKSPYPHHLDIITLFNDPKLAKDTFSRPARLIDLTAMSDQTIKKHKIIALLEYTHKHVRDQKLVKNTIKTLAALISKLDDYVNTNKSSEIDGWFKDYVYCNLHYIYYFANIINNEEFTRELETVDFIKRENVMGAVARKIEQQGIEKGIEKGIKKTALAMLAEGSDFNFISRVTNLTIEEITNLKDGRLDG